MRKPRVADRCFPQVEDLQLGQAAKMDKAGVGRRRGAQRQRLQVNQALEMDEISRLELDRVEVDRTQVWKAGEKRQTGVGQVAASDVDGDDTFGMGRIEFDLAVDFGEQSEEVRLLGGFL